MAAHYGQLESARNSPYGSGLSPYGSGDPYYNESSGYITPPAPKKGVSKWIKVGIPVLILLIAGAVVGGIFGSRHHSSASSSTSAASAAAAASSVASVQQAVGLFPTATDSEFMMPIYPATVSYITITTTSRVAYL